MDVYFLEEANNDADAPRKIVFHGKNYVPRLEDKVRVGSDIYNTVHVEWVYPAYSEGEVAMRKQFGIHGCDPHHVEVIMQKLPIEEPKPSNRDGEVTPFKQEVFSNNCACCRCGCPISAKTTCWHAVVPLNMGSILTIQRVSWCGSCWADLPGGSLSE